MYRDWSQDFPGMRYVGLFALAMTVLLLVDQLSSLLSDFQAGAPLNMKDLGSFVFWASLSPLYVTFIGPWRKTTATEANDDPLQEKIYEEPFEGRIINILVMWSFFIGCLTQTLISGRDGESFISTMAAPIFFAFAVCLGIGTYFRRLYRVSLSPAGISISKIKAGTISWQDIVEAKILRQLGTNTVLLTIKDPAKYGLKRPIIKIAMLLLPATSTELLAAIQLRHSVFGQQKTLSTGHMTLSPAGQMT
jgi:hypothetical protein